MEIVFGTDGWRDVIADRFTFANVRRAARAYAEHLIDLGGGLVLVGHDTRFLAREFAEEAAGVLAARGLDTRVSAGYLPTPALSFAVKHLGAAGGVMITASHNPPSYGGFKLKGPYGGTATQDIYKDVAARVSPDDEPSPGRDVPTFDIREDYYAALKRLVNIEALAAAGARLVHDPMGGAGTGWLAAFAEATGAFELVELRGRPDPLFHGVNPEPIPANLVFTSEVMSGAGTATDMPAFAAVTDGDADRIGIVLPGGTYFDSHQIFAVLLDHLARSGGSGKVVKTFTVSRVVERLARARGLEVVETPVGFKHIVDAMLAGDVLIGGEESGGIGMSAHLPERDAIANALVLLEAVTTSGESLAAAFARIEEEVGWRHAYDRHDITLEGPESPTEVVARLRGSVDDVAGFRVTSAEHLDGLKLNLARNGEAEAWLLFRGSGTEPLLRVYCEAQTQQDVDDILLAAGELVTG